MSRRLAALNLFLRLAVKPRLARTAGPGAAEREFRRLGAQVLRQPPYLRRIERPGGLHVMFIGLHAPLEEGQQFPLTLVFADGSDTTIDVPVKAIGHAH